MANPALCRVRVGIVKSRLSTNFPYSCQHKFTIFSGANRCFLNSQTRECNALTSLQSWLLDIAIKYNSNAILLADNLFLGAPVIYDGLSLPGTVFCSGTILPLRKHCACWTFIAAGDSLDGRSFRQKEIAKAKLSQFAGGTRQSSQPELVLSIQNIRVSFFLTYDYSVFTLCWSHFFSRK